MKTAVELLEDAINEVLSHLPLEREEIKMLIEKAKEIEGAKYQAERMYSEEEVQNILIEYVKTNPTKPYRVVNWFEQFKKK